MYRDDEITREEDLETRLSLANSRLLDLADSFEAIGTAGLSQEADPETFRRLASLPVLYAASDLRGIAKIVDDATLYIGCSVTEL